VAGDSELALALSSPALPLERKNALTARLLEGKARPETIAAGRAGHRRRAGKALERRLQAFVRLAAERRQRLVATVRGGHPAHVGAVRAPPLGAGPHLRKTSSCRSSSTPSSSAASSSPSATRSSMAASSTVSTSRAAPSTG